MFIVSGDLQLRTMPYSLSSKSPTEAIDMMCYVYVYGNEAWNHARFYEWHTWFKNDRTTLDNNKE